MKRRGGGKSKRERLTLDEIQIRGRKFYWHHKPIRLRGNVLLKKDEEKRVIVNPIGTHKRFSFEVYFERLSPGELGHLCNVLDINNSTVHAHKIGRAKPLGFGSVRVKIEEIITRNIDKKTGKYSINVKERKDFFDNQIPAGGELLEMLKFKPQLHGKPVTYPKVKVKKGNKKANDEASHQWFTKNSSNKKIFKQVLPTIEEETTRNDRCIKHKWLKVLKN